MPIYASQSERDMAARVMKKIRDQNNVLSVLNLFGWDIKKRCIVSFIEHKCGRAPVMYIKQVLKYYAEHKNELGPLNR